MAVIYFIPTIIAFRRRHPSRVVILVLNILAFTIILWIVALVWSLKSIRNSD
ncbi:superinfection immunity protein [Thalassospira sp.]|uniref:superinfection immunity protein n=1 Tax=unclassified Thalassospira TaxID=2648997 RepID=UPI00338F7406